MAHLPWVFVGFFFPRGEVVDAEGHEAAHDANRDGPWQMFLLDVLLGFHVFFFTHGILVELMRKTKGS